jgi:hypothetical protein
VKRIIRDYKIELAALVAGLLGLYLIIEPIDLRILIIVALRKITAFLEGWGSSESGRASLSQLFGLLLFACLLCFVIWRIRYHFKKSEQWKVGPCPKCGGSLVRVRRNTWDRFLSHTLLPDSRRYLCSNLKCSWTGLRQRSETEHGRRSVRVMEKQKGVSNAGDAPRQT